MAEAQKMENEAKRLGDQAAAEETLVIALEAQVGHS